MWIVEICRIVLIGLIYTWIGWYVYEFIGFVRAISNLTISQLDTNIILAKTFFRDFTILEWTYPIVIIIILGLIIYYLLGDNKYERYYYEKDETFFLILYIMRICLLIICVFYIIKNLWIIGFHIFLKIWVLHSMNERLKFKSKIYQRK
jgi:hypothetical protein